MIGRPPRSALFPDPAFVRSELRNGLASRLWEGRWGWQERDWGARSMRSRLQGREAPASTTSWRSGKDRYSARGTSLQRDGPEEARAVHRGCCPPTQPGPTRDSSSSSSTFICARRLPSCVSSPLAWASSRPVDSGADPLLQSKRPPEGWPGPPRRVEGRQGQDCHPRSPRDSTRGPPAHHRNSRQRTASARERPVPSSPPSKGARGRPGLLFCFLRCFPVPGR